MYYSVTVRDHIRVPPDQFGKDLKQAITEQVREKFTGFISKETGLVIDVGDIRDIQDGIIIPGDGAHYYESVFDLITFEPEMQEVLPTRVKDIAEFGVFLDVGPIDGLVHISQAMNDFVSFTKDKVLQGKDTGRTLKIGDLCRARIVAISYKDVANPKLGMTMRQQGLGKEEWIEADISGGADEKKKKQGKTKEK
ncbi:DNA-directed RNA polymerase [Candidatus Woesearchaeota archaeon]|nr:MAG: DNA-directed RNA polymerase [Candidatus Woesearchaeota archaeon]